MGYQSQLALILQTFDQTGAAGTMRPNTTRDEIMNRALPAYFRQAREQYPMESAEYHQYRQELYLWRWLYGMGPGSTPFPGVAPPEIHSEILEWHESLATTSVAATLQQTQTSLHQPPFPPHQQTPLPLAPPQHPPVAIPQFQHQQTPAIAPVDSFLRRNMAAKDQYLSISVHFQALPHRQGWQPQLGWDLTGLPQYGLRVIAVNDHISVAGKSQEHANSLVSKWGGIFKLDYEKFRVGGPDQYYTLVWLEFVIAPTHSINKECLAALSELYQFLQDWSRDHDQNGDLQPIDIGWDDWVAEIGRRPLILDLVWPSPPPQDKHQ